MSNQEEMRWEFNQEFIDKLNGLFNRISEKLAKIEDRLDDVESEASDNGEEIRKIEIMLDDMESRIR